MVDDLKMADDCWRDANPNKAAEVPVDAFGSELADLTLPYLKSGRLTL
jgi:hypothetical protein